MTALDRRTLMAVTIAGIATPTTLGAKECPTLDWVTISIRNGEHVGPENARKKTEAWAAASQNNLNRQQCQRCGPLEAQLALGAKNIALEIGNPPPSV